MFQQFLRKLIALSLILPFNGILVRGFEARQSKLPDAIPGYALEQIQQAQGTTISVTSPLDDVEDNQNCTLREAIIAANTHSPRDRCVAGSGANTIILPAGVYNIWLSGPNDESSLAGDLDITDSLTITGASAETTTLDGNNLDRILHIHGSSTVVYLSGLKFLNGYAPNNFNGGAIDNEGSLTISNSLFSENKTTAGGGAIYNSGTLTTTNTSYSTNHWGGEGGAIYNSGTVWMSGTTLSNHVNNDSGGAGGILNYGSMTILASSIFGNGDIYNPGGGIENKGTLLIQDSILSENFAGSGGNIYNTGSLTILNSTIQSGGTRFGGGGIYNNTSASMALKGVTIRGNTARFGGGLMGAGDTIIENSAIIQNQTNEAFCGGIFNTGGNWIIRNTTISGNISVGDGGGLCDAGQTSLDQVTITGNSAGGSGGGIGMGSKISIHNTLIAGNQDSQVSQESSLHPDCSLDPGVIVSKGHNLVGKADGCNWVAAPGDQTGFIASPLDPLLAELADNGGPTWTHGLLQNSPAVDGGECSLPTDQRDVARPQGVTCDIGAYEATFLYFGDASVLEGDKGTTAMVFPVTLSGASAGAISFRYATADSTAIAGHDYVGAAEVITIPAGITSPTITIYVKGDTVKEPDVTFTVNLDSPKNVILKNSLATGKILDDDKNHLYLPTVVQR